MQIWNTTFKIFSPYDKALEQSITAGARNVSINATNEFSFSEHFKADCQTCFKFISIITLRGYTSRNSKDEKKFSIEKIGQYPPLQINPEPIFKDFLSKPDLKFYEKGKSETCFIQFST